MWPFNLFSRKIRSESEFVNPVWRDISTAANLPKPRPFNAERALRQFKHWAFAAAMLNANAVANVPLRLFTRKRAGKKLYRTRPVDSRTKRLFSQSSHRVATKVAQFAGELEEVVEPHPAITILQKVNPHDNGYSLSVLRMIDLQVTGNSYWVVQYGLLGVPEGVYRLPPQHVEIIPSKTNLIQGYRWGVRPDTTDYPEPDVDHFKAPNPRNLLYGMGWYEAAWEAIELHDSKRTMDLSKFDNMARPDWLLTLKNVSSARKEAIDTFKKDVNEKLRGEKNQGQFLVLPMDADAKSLNFDVPEVGTPTRVIEEISAVSGVPVAMLLSNDPTRASSEVARVGWYRNTIRPYCRNDEERLNERWLPRFAGSEDMVLCYDFVSFEDQQEQAKRLTGLVAGGVITPNEARADLGYDLSTDPEADRLYPPSGNTGEAAAITGDANPEQNDERNN